VVILTGGADNLPARHLVAELARAGMAPAAVLIDPLRRRRPEREPAVKQKYLIYLRHGMLRYAFKKFTRGLRRRFGARLRLDLPELPTLGAQNHIPVQWIDNVNEPEGLKALRALEPDVLIMMGCRILKAPVLAVPRLALNFHTGILPYYRGADTIYWAMKNGEPQRVGYSIHEGVEALDAGRVFFEEAVPPEPGELLEDIYARLVRRATPHWPELLRQYQALGELPGRALDLEAGRLYKAADWWAHAQLENAWLSKGGTR